jgi:hypothetical protein
MRVMLRNILIIAAPSAIRIGHDKIKISPNIPEKIFVVGFDYYFLPPNAHYPFVGAYHIELRMPSQSNTQFAPNLRVPIQDPVILIKKRIS